MTINEQLNLLEKQFYKERDILRTKPKGINAFQQLKKSYENTKKMIYRNEFSSTNTQLKYGMFSAFYGLGSSVLSDLYEADALYDSLRKVNSNFIEMSNSEIWFETLLMEEEKLLGMANLAKGAYFEELVAEETGGVLHENFNYEDTDIVIDGEEVQLKATDSSSYINSIDEDIKVMSTSEVAFKTDVIDSGISNSEITDLTDAALGGSVVDVGEGVTDALLFGAAGLGTFGTIRGIDCGMTEYERTQDMEKSVEIGAKVAIVGTAQGIYNTGNLVHKAVTSEQAKSFGRGTVKTSKALYEVATSDTSKTIGRGVLKTAKVTGFLVGSIIKSCISKK